MLENIHAFRFKPVYFPNKKGIKIITEFMTG
jgi:hypothetical protein